MDIINLVEEQLDVNSIYSKVVEHSTGAVSLFVGTTRNNFEGKKVMSIWIIQSQIFLNQICFIFKVISLEYEAFKPMACKEIKKICENIREKWKVKHIAFHHRYNFFFYHTVVIMRKLKKHFFVCLFVLITYFSFQIGRSSGWWSKCCNSCFIRASSRIFRGCSIWDWRA